MLRLVGLMLVWLLSLPSEAAWSGISRPSTDDPFDTGSCWAFSAVATVEAITKIKTGKLISLSEQELVDCDAGQGDEGCQGGFMEKAFQFIKRNGGLTTEDKYPYKGINNAFKLQLPSNRSLLQLMLLAQNLCSMQEVSSMVIVELSSTMELQQLAMGRIMVKSTGL